MQRAPHDASPGEARCTSGPYPAALQEVWASTAKQRFPSNPWMLREGPSMVAVLQRAEDFSTATCELWLPMERGL
ncbi:hypothetical protein AS038_08365 [Arthrobacter sp. NIO-1057]|nr:hypothetical protein AS038_08365 [Arthrobacter sp. NIO-1057]